MDTFGGPGQHHTLSITPGAIVVAQLPALTNAAGTVSASQVIQSPNDGVRYRLVFSRCPGDLTSFWLSQPNGATACYFETTNYAAPCLLNWSETVGGTSTCRLPPANGPWYGNFTVDYDPANNACSGMINGCVINWQWN